MSMQKRAKSWLISFFLNGVVQDTFKEIFNISHKDKIIKGRYKIDPSQVSFLEGYIPESLSLGRRLSWALKSVTWNFETHNYFLEAYPYEPST